MDAITKILKEFQDLFSDRNKNGTHSPNQTCPQEPINSDYIYTVACIPAILITLVLGAFFQRKNILRNRCDGRPGLIIPMNGLEMHHERVAFALAFGSLIGVALKIFDQNSLPFYVKTDPGWVQTLKQILAVVMYGTAWYPLFAAITAELMIGYILGAIYGLAMLGIHMYNIVMSTVACEYLEARITSLMETLPKNIFLALLCAHFVRQAVHCYYGRKPPSVKGQAREIAVMNTYVKHLLSTNKTWRMNHKLKIVVEKLRHLHYLSKTGFLFPPRLLCSLLVAASVVYTLMLKLYILIMESLDSVLKFVAAEGNMTADHRTMQQVVDAMRSYSFSNLNTLSTVALDTVRMTYYVIFVIQSCLLVALTLASIVSLCHFPFIIINYRRNVLLAFKSQYPIIQTPSQMKNVDIFIGFSRLSGYQIAYLVWGFLIQFLVLFFLNVLIAFLLVIPLKFGYGQFWVNLLRNNWPLPTLALVVIIAENIVMRLFFIQPGDRTSLALTNRKVFFVWTYYLFFYNILLGFVSCLFRIIKSSIIGVLFVGRVDLPGLPRAFENFDPGFRIYCGFVLAEVAHNNPILRTFIAILQESVVESEADIEYSLPRGSLDSRHLVEAEVEEMAADQSFKDVLSKRRRIRRRWYVAYTLVRNDGLNLMRKKRNAITNELATS